MEKGRLHKTIYDKNEICKNDKNLIVKKFAKLKGADISSIKTELKEFLGF
jgi:hypothetical protein